MRSGGIFETGVVYNIGGRPVSAAGLGCTGLGAATQGGCTPEQRAEYDAPLDQETVALLKENGETPPAGMSQGEMTVCSVAMMAIFEQKGTVPPDNAKVLTPEVNKAVATYALTGSFGLSGQVEANAQKNVASSDWGVGSASCARDYAGSYTAKAKKATGALLINKDLLSVRRPAVTTQAAASTGSGSATKWILIGLAVVAVVAGYKYATAKD